MNIGKKFRPSGGLTVALMAFSTCAPFSTVNAADYQEPASQIGEQQQTEPALTELAFTLGTYEGETEMADGRLYRVRTTSDWWLAGKAIRGRSWDAYDDGDWNPFYVGFQAWHGGREQIAFNSVGRDGEFVTGHIEVEPGPILYWYWSVVNEKGRSREGRDSWTFNEAGSEFLWTFAMKAPNGEYDPYFEILMKRID